MYGHCGEMTNKSVQLHYEKKQKRQQKTKKQKKNGDCFFYELVTFVKLIELKLV